MTTLQLHVHSFNFLFYLIHHYHLTGVSCTSFCHKSLYVQVLLTIEIGIIQNFACFLISISGFAYRYSSFIKQLVKELMPFMTWMREHLFYCLFVWWCLMLLSTIYFSYVVAVSFIGGGNRRTWRKPPTCHKPLTTFVLVS